MNSVVDDGDLSAEWYVANNAVDVDSVLLWQLWLWLWWWRRVSAGCGVWLCDGWRWKWWCVGGQVSGEERGWRWLFAGEGGLLVEGGVPASRTQVEGGVPASRMQVGVRGVPSSGTKWKGRVRIVLMGVDRKVFCP